MRAIVAAVLLVAAALPAWVQSPHVAGVRLWSTRYNEDLQKIDGARREALAVLEEKAPSNPADWIVKDVPEARTLLDQTRERP